MRLGIVARSDYTGLAVQTQALVRHLNPDKVLVPDMQHLNGNVTVIPDWFPNAVRWTTHNYPDLAMVKDDAVDDFLKDLDVVITCETPYSYYLFERAEELGVKSVLQFNYEFFDYMNHPELPKPTLFASPSMWHISDVKGKFSNTTFLPVPVDTDVFRFKHRTHLRKLLHTVGTGTGEDRNGTKVALSAMPFVKAPVTLTVRSQRNLAFPKTGKVVYVAKPTPRPEFLYMGDEDAYLMPRRFGGLCLPLNEAIACGMPVIVPDVSPQDSWVPQELRVGGGVATPLQTRNVIDCYEFDPQPFADKVDELHDSPELFSALSAWAGEYAQSISWNTLKSEYNNILRNL